MSEETKQEAGFLIDGAEYPIPNVWDFDADEEQILWDYTGLVLADFIRVDPEAEDAERLEAERKRRLLHPGLTRTYLHVAYRRGNRDVKDAEIRRLIGTVKRLEAMERIFAEDDADPPAPTVTTTTPDESSPSVQSVTDATTTDSPASSTPGSKNGSDDPAKTPAPTGAGR